MRLTRDPEHGILYLRIREGQIHESVDSNEAPVDVTFDLDRDGNVLGVEILDVEAVECVEIPDRVSADETVQQ